MSPSSAVASRFDAGGDDTGGVVADPASRNGRLRGPGAAGAVLLAVYLCLSLLMSPGGYLGTDTGAKVATLDRMVDEGSWRPDLGYWAEDFDPDGTLHPIFDSAPVADGWVHVTTLPMLLVGRPLYDLGGYGLALLVPMIGAVAVAFGARSLARGRVEREGRERVGWTAFWVVGLASPITVYALDFWEHAPGVACMVGAVVLLGQIVEASRSHWWALPSGALLGLAGTMRTEAFAYALVAVGLACLIELRRRGVRPSLAIGAASMAGFGAVWLVNGRLEQAVGGLERSGRVSGAATGGASDLDQRLREAWTTLVAIRPSDGSELVGLGLVALVGAALLYERRGDPRMVRGTLVGAAALYMAIIAGGLDFVPGMLVAAPLAVAGLVGGARRGQGGGSYAFGVAVLTLPLVWGFQFVGGARPQWAGRYALTSCVLLVTLGVAYLASRRDRVLHIGLVGLSGLVTLTGVLWLRERSHQVDRYFEVLVERPEDVIVARNGFFIREGGPAYADRLWLTAVSDGDLETAVGVVREAGFDTFAVLDDRPSSPGELAGAALQETTSDSVVGTTFYLHSYKL